jgi:hypothetical protein
MTSFRVVDGRDFVGPEPDAEDLEPTPVEVSGSAPVLVQREDEQPITVALKVYRTILADKGYRLLTDIAAAQSPKKPKVGAREGTAKRAGSDDLMCSWAEPVSIDEPEGDQVYCSAVAEHVGDHLLMPVAGIIRTLSTDAVMRWIGEDAARASLVFDAEQEKPRPRANLLESVAALIEGGKSSETDDGDKGDTEDQAGADQDDGDKGDEQTE